MLFALLFAADTLVTTARWTTPAAADSVIVHVEGLAGGLLTQTFRRPVPAQAVFRQVVPTSAALSRTWTLTVQICTLANQKVTCVLVPSTPFVYP